MGVKNGSKCLHSLSGLTYADLVVISRGLALQNSNAPTPVTPVIGVDCSNIWFHAGKTVEGVVNFMARLANAGFRTVPVCDGTRPIAKQATPLRNANRERERIKAFILRTEIGKEQRQLNSNWNISKEERAIIQDGINKKVRTMKSKETRCKETMVAEFDKRLEEKLQLTGAHERSTSGGTITTVQLAEYQADGVLMAGTLAGGFHMVMSRDSDIPILAGDKCIAVKEFMKDEEIEIVSIAIETIINAQNQLDDIDKQHTIIKHAKNPIFDGVKYPKARAMMALILGSDVYEGGVYGIGPPNLEKAIRMQYPKWRRQRRKENSPASLFRFLRQYMVDHMKGAEFNEEAVKTLVRGLIYEPTNLESIDDDDEEEDNKQRTYLGGKEPTELPEYLEEFKGKGTVITEDGPRMKACCGVGDSSHKFLSAAGYEECQSCGRVVCRSCQGKADHQDDDGQDIYCLGCYAVNALVPGGEEVRATTISDMRNELQNVYDVERAEELTVTEVQDLYAIKEVVKSHIDELLDSAPLPLYEPNELDSPLSSHWDSILDIDFGEGGSFVMDPDLNAKYLPGVLELFSALIRFEDKKHTDWLKDSPVYECMPEMFIRFAEKSRIDSGYRLLVRCIRHSLDIRIPLMDTRTGGLVLDQDGDIGVWLWSLVPASMRKETYETEIVATAKNILCCKCTCQCGAEGTERVVDVHTMVPLYLLSILLMEDLAEHLLISLAARISGAFDADDDVGSENNDSDWMWSVSEWSDDDIKIMKENIGMLMEAAGELVTFKQITEKS